MFSLTVLAAAVAGSPADPFPLDLAYGAKQLSPYYGPAVSPDGRRVAYAVVTPTRLRDGRRGDDQGTPETARGHRLFVADTATGAFRDVSPANANAWAASWSPDGSAVSFYSDAGGQVGLWVYRAGGSAAARLGKVVVAGNSHMRPEWTPDGARVLVPVREKPADKKPGLLSALGLLGGDEEKGPPTAVTVRTSGGERRHSPPRSPEEASFAGPPAALAEVSAADGTSAVLIPAGGKPTFIAAKLSPSGRFLACESALRTGEGPLGDALTDLTVVRRSDGKALLAVEGVKLDENGDPFAATLLPLAWHPAEDRLAYLHGGKLFSVDATADAPKATELPTGELADRVAGLSWTREGKSLLVRVKADESLDEDPVLAKVVRLPSDGGKPVGLVPPAGVKLRGVVAADWRTAWQPTADAVLASGVDRADGSPVLVRLPLDGSASAVVKRFTNVTRLVAAPADHRFAVAQVEGAAGPPDLFALDRGFDPSVRLSRAEPRLENRAVGPVEFFTTLVTAADGKAVEVRSAVALPPGGKRGGKFPAVVNLYPGSNLSGLGRHYGGGDVSTIPAQVFTSRGYAVLHVDVPLRPSGVPSNPLEEIRGAVLPQVYRAAELGYIDIDRVGVSGQSYGGYGAACLAAGTNVFKAAVPVSGVYDLAGGYARQSADEKDGLNFNMFWSEKGQGRMGKPLWDDPKRYLDNSPYFLADRVRTPLLIVHGRDDDTWAVEDAEKFFNALRRLDRTAQLAVYEGEGHVPSEWSRAHAIDLSERVLGFLDRHLRPAAGPPGK